MSLFLPFFYVYQVFIYFSQRIYTMLMAYIYVTEITLEMAQDQA